ncbi:ribose-5-phosphate isomerase RpiA [Caulobacter sp. S45]|uniref:ribose-5-phosphate isomerase RpiA n=1 Tax=Caulobacter sp. S45 TaxID=1641861 RepID=UPI0015754986|nr:ribose-5-phosphate isomerase RpiA [Caulobacter sp. S45]
MTTADEQKRAVGEAAAALVEDGMTVGLGTGSTAAQMVRALGMRVKTERLRLRCVATSDATAALGVGVGLDLVELDAAGRIDLTLDGADEIGPDLALLKGGGAALLREKLVWEASRRCIVISDASKVVGRLGRFPLPVEVVAFGHASTATRLAAAAREAGITAEPRLRAHQGATVSTDGGNVIYDVSCGVIPEPARLAAALDHITGVVEHGLFLKLADGALIAGPEGVRWLHG